MYKIVLFLFFAFCFSCTSGDERQHIDLFNSISFELKQSERVLPLDDDIKSSYEALINKEKVQIPLFRAIGSADYRVYIGLPYNSTLNKLSSTPLLVEQAQLLKSQNGSPDSFMRTYTLNSSHVHEFSKSFDNNNLIYMIAVTDSKSVADSFFNYDEFSNRLTIK